MLLAVAGLVCLRQGGALKSGQPLRISGFSFIRNGDFLGYPFVPAIRSLLPLCDEIIVNVPRSTDGTLEAVKSIGDPKIRVIESDWDDNEKIGDPVMRRHTDLALEQCSGDWCVYIQGDEVLHEETIPAMRSTMQRELSNPTVQGLLVDYTHFYGSFWTEVYSLGWYYKEIRVVRRDPKIRAWGGAQGFRTTDRQKLRVKNSGGRYFHYGYALEPNQARVRVKNLNELYGNLEDQRYSLIIAPELNLFQKGPEWAFGEENDAWNNRISDPILRYYHPVYVQKDFNVEILMPNTPAGK